MKSRPEKGNAPELLPSEASSVKNQGINLGVDMNDSTLVPVFTGNLSGRITQLCDARTLHIFMQVRRDFTTWIKGRIRKFGFIAGKDYLLTKSGEQLPSGTKYVHDYHLTLDMAKELAMVENNEQGRAARRYFIECERRALAAATTSIPAIDYARISPAQAQDLKQIVQAIVDAGIQSYGETWKRFQNKFRVNSYLQLPATQHLEARKYLIAKLPNGYAGEVVDETPAPAMNLDDAVRLDLAFSMSAQAGAQVQRSVFASVMQGDADWTCKRYISNLTYDRMTNRLTAPATRVMDHGEMVTTLDKLPDWINGNDPIFASDEQLANIAMACTMRLSRNMSRQSAIRN